MTLKERVAHLCGLVEGLSLSDTAENKVINEIVSILTDMSAEIASLKEDTKDLSDVVDEIDEALADVEDEVFGECECEDGDDEDYVEVTCPKCGETVYLDETVDPESVKCPACGETFSCVCDDEDCDCCCHHDKD